MIYWKNSNPLILPYTCIEFPINHYAIVIMLSLSNSIDPYGYYLVIVRWITIILGMQLVYSILTNQAKILADLEYHY